MCFGASSNYLILLDFKFIANIGCISSIVAHVPSCLHVCRSRRIILVDSAFLVSTEGISRQV